VSAASAPQPTVARLQPTRMGWLRERPSHLFRLGEDTIAVRVRESTRARTARIVVGPTRPLEVIVPIGMHDAEIDGLLEQKRAWIGRKVGASRAIAQRPRGLGLDRAGVVWLAGMAVPVSRRPGGRSSATRRDQILVVSGPDDRAGDAILRWYRREARRRIPDVVAREAARLDLEYRSVAVRDQRTRWGSCSRHGNLSFSWRLVAAPLEVLEYVVIHELCHLREPSHSKPFHRLLGAARPGWRDQARWLRMHGAELHEYDPTP
jgi:predicted metal-dependent hydrolase